MNLISLIGAFIVTIAFLLYGIGSITILQFKLISPGVLWFFSMGILFDIVATVFIIKGSSNNLLSLHGIFRLTAISGMLVVVILIWRIYFKNKLYAEIGEKLRAYLRMAFSWWIIAYITGSLLVIGLK